MEIKWLCIAAAIILGSLSIGTSYVGGKKEESRSACFKAAATNLNLRCQ